MFVTSDIFDLATVTSGMGNPGWCWREQLVGGVGFHGTDYPGASAAARFLTEAAELCGLREQEPLAGYSLQWGEPYEPVEPDCIWALARGAFPPASTALGVFLEVAQGSVATDDRVCYGGELSAAARMSTEDGVQAVPDYPYQAFDGYFCFPLYGEDFDKGEALLRLGADVLGIDYGYYFVRDAYAKPHYYAQGPGMPVDRSVLGRADRLEVDTWTKFVREGELWTGVWPQLRDVFAANLLSERHLSAFIEPIGYLEDWITAEPGRGRLASVGNKRVLWTLTDAEIHAVRPKLWDLALTRSCMPRVYRDLPYARERPDPDTGKVSARTSGT